MKKIIIIFILLIIGLLIGLNLSNQNQTTKEIKVKPHKLTGNILSKTEDTVTIRDRKNIIYTFKTQVNDLPGKNITIEYEGNLNKNITNQENNVISYQLEDDQSKNMVPIKYLDNGIFQECYQKANKKLKKMTIEEKISQLLLVRYPEENQKEVLKNYQFGGYLFFAKDIKDKTKEQIKEEIKNLQSVSKIPILTAVDEEGGIVVRVSSNKNLRNERFLSPRDLYQEGGLKRIEEDTLEKSTLLEELGFNLNLAPVVDVSVNPTDYMYQRSIGENSEITSQYAKTVIKTSKKKSISYTLKHFPGYGNNTDTHNNEVIDNRSIDYIKENDLPPFKAGIKSGAEAVLVSHNIVTSIDQENPASLSSNIHNLLRNELDFTGIIITDDLEMGATNNIEDNSVKALLSGNDLLIVTDYEKSINSIKQAIEEERLSKELIDRLAFRILAWKYYKKML